MSRPKNFGNDVSWLLSRHNVCNSTSWSSDSGREMVLTVVAALAILNFQLLQQFINDDGITADQLVNKPNSFLYEANKAYHYRSLPAGSSRETLAQHYIKRLNDTVRTWQPEVYDLNLWGFGRQSLVIYRNGRLGLLDDVTDSSRKKRDHVDRRRKKHLDSINAPATIVYCHCCCCHCCCCCCCDCRCSCHCTF